MSIRLSHNPGDYLDPKTRRYRVESLLSRGGMGTVYKAVDTQTQDVKAVKECDLLDDPRRKQMSREDAVCIFMHEARCLENLDHHGIPGGTLLVVAQQAFAVCARCGNTVNETTCTICALPADSLYYQPTSIAHRYYLVMDFVDGEDLDTLVGAMPRPLQASDVRTIIGWLSEAASILNYVHSQGLAHCDVKPENLRVRKHDGQLFLLDFGLQQMEAGNTRVLKPACSTKLGTPGYAAPEQEKGQPRPRSDIYGFAMTGAHLLTGLDPANPEQKRELLENRLSFWIPDLHQDIGELVYHGLSMDADLRPTAQACFQTLHKIDPIQKAATPKNKQTQPSDRRTLQVPRWWKQTVVALIAVLVCIAVVKSLTAPPDDLVIAEASTDARVFRKPNQKEIMRRLEGGESLELQYMDIKEGHWFRVFSVNGEKMGGYIRRGEVHLDSPRGANP